MDFKEYDKKIKEELEEYEKLQWEVYYRTLLPDFMQQFEDDYAGKPEDKEQALKDHEAALIARHMPRVQRSLDKKREELTSKYLRELNERLESAQNEADQDEDEWRPEDYEELEDEPEALCKGDQPLASEIISDQSAEIEKLKAKLQEARNDAKAFEEDWKFVLSQRDILRAQLDIIAFALKFHNYECLEMAQHFVRTAYNQQPPEEKDEQEVEE